VKKKIVKSIPHHPHASPETDCWKSLLVVQFVQGVKP